VTIQQPTLLETAVSSVFTLLSAGINNARDWLEKTRRRTVIKNLIKFMSGSICATFNINNAKHIPEK